MSNRGCLRCGGTGLLLTGGPCPDCAKTEKVTMEYVKNIPMQYQGITFNKEFLPSKMQKGYGDFLQEFLDLCSSVNIESYTRNHLVCSKPNSGKTIWAYNIIGRLNARGIVCPSIVDLTEFRSILNGFNKEEYDLYSKARCVIVRIPSDIQTWMFDTMLYILERRVNHGGFTIFIFNGELKELEAKDSYHKFSDMKGDGSFLTVKTDTYYTWRNDNE